MSLMTTQQKTHKMTKEQKRNFIDYLEKSVNKTERIKGVIKTLKNKGWK